MKFVVPLTMPITRRMRSPASDSRSGRMSGIPPATDASNSRSTPAFSAASNSSWPKLASSSLFAVTTGLHAFSAAEHQAARRLDAADHLDDHVDVRIGDDRLGVVREHAARRARRRDPWRGCAPRHAPTWSCTPVRREIRSRFSSRSRTSAAPTLPHPRIPTRTSAMSPVSRSCIRCPSGSGRRD